MAHVWDVRTLRHGDGLGDADPWIRVLIVMHCKVVDTDFDHVQLRHRVRFRVLAVLVGRTLLLHRLLALGIFSPLTDV